MQKLAPLKMRWDVKAINLLLLKVKRNTYQDIVKFEFVKLS